MTQREALVVLNLLDGIGPIRTRQLLEFFGEATKVLQAPHPALRRVKGIGDDLASTIRQWETTTDLAGELKRVEEFGARLIFQEDDEYPELLREIYDPPIVLYVKGRLLPEDRNSISMVGARRTTHYGQDTARKLAYQLAGAGITVVSGGARHRLRLASGRPLGQGPNPRRARHRHQHCLPGGKRGAVRTHLGERRRAYPVPLQPEGRQAELPNPQPHRRRDDAWHRGGGGRPEKRLTNHANMAGDNNRQVFAVPGRVDSPQSRGCHNLIREGAVLCENADDILAEFENLALGQADAPPNLPLANLTETEQKILDVLDATEQPIDTLIDRTDLPVSSVSVALLGLEMKRLAKQLPGKLFARR